MKRGQYSRGKLKSNNTQEVLVLEAVGVLVNSCVNQSSSVYVGLCWVAILVGCGGCFGNRQFHSTMLFEEVAGCRILHRPTLTDAHTSVLQV